MAVLSYKCPNCDGGLAFDPASQKFGCDYCGSRFTEEELLVLNPKRQSEGQKEEPRAQGEEVAVLYSCPSCGAEVVTDATTAATFCYYCHNPVVLAGRLEGDYTPDKVIPFTIDKNQAINSFLGWAKKKWFIPKAFFSASQIEKVSGVYFPYWMADLEVQGKMDATATQIRVWRVGNTEFTETRHFQLEREGSFRFADMTRNALKKAERKLVEGVLPFQTQGMKDFQMGYLSGFQAEKRDIEKGEVEPGVIAEAKSYTDKLLRESTQGYAMVSPKSLTADISSGDWRYTLLPVWVLTYKGGNGSMYYYAMNGQTGKVCGVLPVDKGRLARFAAAVGVPLFALLCLGGWFL